MYIKTAVQGHSFYYIKRLLTTGELNPFKHGCDIFYCVLCVRKFVQTVQWPEKYADDASQHYNVKVSNRDPDLVP